MVADESSSAPKPKRRLRTSSETVRERAAKAQADDNRPKRRTAGKFGKVFAPLRPVGRFLRKMSRFIVPPYFRNSWRELRQVTWPKWKQSRQLTGAVVVFSVIFGVIIAVVDLGLDKVFKKVILKQ